MSKYWTGDKLLSIAAIILSLSTLIVFIYQTNLIRKQQYMSVFPYLELGDYGISTKNYKFVLENAGIGPALIKDFKVIYQGKVYEEDIATFLPRIIDPKDTIGFYYANLEAGRLIPPNSPIELLGISDKKLKSANRLYDLVHKDDLTIEIEYESIYGERWQLSNTSSVPLKLK